MENLTLPLRFKQNYYAERRRTNINLDRTLKKKAAEVARDRYGYSLSELVNRLLQAEVKLKRGLLAVRG